MAPTPSHRPFELGTFVSAHFRTLSGQISSPALEETVGHLDDVRDVTEAVALLRTSLIVDGFAAAPCSAELVSMLRELSIEQARNAGAEFRKCVGMSSDQLLESRRFSLTSQIADIVRASVAQLELVLPDAVVLGPLEGTYRGERGAISWLHSDEDRTTTPYLQQVLFPLPRSDIDMPAPENILEHYNEVRSRVAAKYCLTLPASEQDGLDTDLMSFTSKVIAAIQGHNVRCADEMLLDVVNVWIPKGEKQIALLPLSASSGQFQHDTRPSIEEAGTFKDEFQAYRPGTVVLFFGRYVVHQAEATTCPHGSMETRYLVLIPKSRSHRYSSFRPSCVSQKVAKSEEDLHCDVNAGPCCAGSCADPQDEPYLGMLEGMLALWEEEGVEGCEKSNVHCT